MRNEDYLAKMHSDYSHLSCVEKQKIAYEQSKVAVYKTSVSQCVQ